MLRAFFGALAGYLLLAVWVIVTSSLVWQLLGCGFAFTEPGSFDITLRWSLAALVLGFAGAYLAGKAAFRIGGWKAAKVLVLVIVILGIMGAVSQLNRDAAQMAQDREGLDPCELTTFEAASKSSAPAWYDFLNPLVGALGVWMAGQASRRKDAPEIGDSRRT